MSLEKPYKISGHKTQIYRLGRSHNPNAGPWMFQCECGVKKVALGQAMVARYKKKHEDAVVFDVDETLSA